MQYIILVFSGRGLGRSEIVGAQSNIHHVQLVDRRHGRHKRIFFGYVSISEYFAFSSRPRQKHTERRRWRTSRAADRRKSNNLFRHPSTRRGRFR